VAVPEVAPDGSHVYHLYTIRRPRRDELVKHLNAHVVQTAVNYPTALPFLEAYGRFKLRPEHRMRLPTRVASCRCRCSRRSRASSRMK
jgi:dTDP-4-amino-4,6-dideoxygalactose transaminase